MSRPFAGSRSGIPTTLRLAVAALVTLAACAVVATPASAAPAPAPAPVPAPAGDLAAGKGHPVATEMFTIQKTKPDLSRMTPFSASNKTATVSQFNCYYGYYPPGYSIDFYCYVYTGAIQIYLECTDPLIRGYSPVLPAPGTYSLRAVCGPPAVWSYWNVVDA
ncbi:hypothetical protein I0C86_39400 [Plantactinospora sp. S1510]|uniref:Uncharacterized protein n=1 Tax=Plantactinospora alkalitolerans TaxID=2789879 RepID=A0ABS0H904_9ACTN|nr:hypothetical protein [Plantactinospora alkalitolerans]MBF9134947.1 hypothetical protein [Plantactinospora alkalitolerans]